MSPFKLRDHVAVAPEALRAIAERHASDACRIQRLPGTGIFNRIYRLGDHLILRVPRNHPDVIAAIHTETVAVPAARAAGVRMPRLIAVDDSGELLPVPFAIYERVHGETLGLLDLEPGDTPEVWRELGRDLARAHVGVPLKGPVGRLEAKDTGPDPRSILEARAAAGWFTALEVRWLGRLAPAALEPLPRRFLHGDVQATNVMVRGEPPEYQAVIDWGAASLGDVALDSGGVPLRAMTFLLQGHRQIAPLDRDETAEARIVWRHLQLALWTLPRGAVPGLSWAERPLEVLLDVMRFFAEPTDGRWEDAGPT